MPKKYMFTLHITEKRLETEIVILLFIDRELALAVLQVTFRQQDLTILNSSLILEFQYNSGNFSTLDNPEVPD